jgi:integrase
MQKLRLSKTVEDFCKVVSGESQLTGTAYAQRLHDFDSFLNDKYGTDLDKLVAGIEAKKFDVYNVLAAYRMDLQSRRLAKSTITTRVIAAKVFLEYNNVAISRTIFKLRVRNLVRRKPDLQPLEKGDVRKIIQACQSPRLQAYVLLLAGSGMRAAEALSVRLKDIDFEKRRIELRAEYTKTKTARTVYLTEECVRQLKLWKEYRERERQVGNNKKVARPFKADDLFFSSGKFKDVEVEYIYHFISRHFSASLDRAGYGQRDENKGKHHKITFHSFRRFVKTTISDLGYQDYSEWFIGHSGSTYWRKSEREKLEIFRKIEPYLTYLDYSSLDAKGADFETKLQEKDDRITNLEKQLGDISKMLYEAGILRKD